MTIGSGLVVQVVSALLRGNWQDFNRHDVSRGPSAIAELLVYVWTNDNVAVNTLHNGSQQLLNGNSDDGARLGWHVSGITK